MSNPPDPHRDLAGVLHDVSNALTVLLGWVGQAQEPGATAEDIRHALSVIEQRARIARDLARHAIGGPRIDGQRDLREIIDETCRALALEAQRASVRLVPPSPGASATVAGALDLSQVLTNLVLNACAHAPPFGVVEISVALAEERCEVTVTDDGPGVPESRGESIFRGDSRRPSGIGVGLRHSRELARACRGDVELLPGEAKGARFRIVWPRVDVVPRPPVSSRRVSGLSGLRVLVVEDDRAVVQLLETVLEARDADVTTATTAAELRAATTSVAFDVALIDMSPIAADAVGALEALRESSPDVTIVLLTGNADAAPEVFGTDVSLIRKPFEVREVVDVLTELVRKR